MEKLMVLLPSMKAGHKEFSEFLKQETGYFNEFLLLQWRKKYNDLAKQLGTLPYQQSDLSDDDKGVIDDFLAFDRDGETRRKAFNQAFVPKELRRTHRLLSDVEGRKLDQQQRIAVVTDEDANLVVAGAGSGKTTTVVGKVKYLTEQRGVDPEQILLISYTRKSVDDLVERIQVPGIAASTFHKLGIDLIREGTGKKPSIFPEDELDPLLNRIMTEIAKDPGTLKELVSFLSEHAKVVKPDDAIANKGEYYRLLKEQGTETFSKTRRVRYRTLDTLQRERTKSFQECYIANMLLFHGIRYEYEESYEYDTAESKFSQYYPDFSIYQGDKRIYLEHYGVDRNNNCPKYWAGEEPYEQVNSRYQAGMEWKRNVHRGRETICLETFSYEYYEGTLFEQLKKQLEEQGFTVERLPDEKILAIIKKNAPRDYAGLLKLLKTFIALWKSNNATITELRKKVRKTEDKIERRRHESFLHLAYEVYKRYNARLQEQRMIDFADMINKATRLVKSGKPEITYSYIIVDEFQDISMGRYMLLKAIRDANPGCKLFCVGDDWQSIYRFSGSDISLFSRFARHFGTSEILKIERTYRFKKPLIGLSSKFITQNPSQLKKNLKGLAGGKTHYKFLQTDENSEHQWQVVAQQLNELCAHDPDIREKSILFLGRFGFDRKLLLAELPVVSPISVSGSKVVYQTASWRLSGTFMTAHGSKGLEADIVFVLNCNSGKYGFPSQVADDPVLNLLLSEADQFENGEERRLFYVAMTRAKERVYFVSNGSNPSKFVTEMRAEELAEVKKCPRCVSADLRRSSGTTNGREWVRWSCSNEYLGCEYLEWGE